ncbi:glycosyltransferase family 2 protein [Haloarcula salinisoli]|uniref:Glycosyltransferase family 2 protein n=1 Tax=Haloarcula salinisoli TaxID=2487746 RepID=A0A8J8CB60_9EURY|nr:glycosyltransferase family 2 protein [Halomicroarcula salinisoli]MBX0286446.1 glycosyltransferase family 2 protein [Halomicroarcula salinisoli]MBX0302065.1 glycosyltransferase family 2 protein [Halomicroarcula salinisoli]
MKTERLSLTGVGAVFLLTAVATVLPSLAPAGVDWGQLFDYLLWGTTVLFTGTALVWVVLTYVVGRGYEEPAPVHGGDDIQVRILTVDAAAVVQQTVDSLPTELDDVHVIAEADIDVAGATVHVVPDGFDCDAVRKGRAIEWARQTLGCDREYVLYLDEDSIVDSFDGLPDADIVQLREQPRRTGSVWTYLADVYRMGVQVEQRAFARLSIPLFAWGGGIAVRSDLEDEVTWDRETLVEDTAFVWAAAKQFDIDFELATATCRNEAPPSLTEILQQRRRWAAGNVEASTDLPLGYQLLTRVRNYAWALSPVVTLVVVPLSVLGVGVGGSGLFALTSLLLGALTLFWYLRGVCYYGREKRLWAVAVPLAPLITVVHSMGTVVGILAPPTEFRVTEKVG